MTLNPPAEYGRTGQGITTFTIRSGSNQFHGSAYEFVRNCSGLGNFCLDARGFFAPDSPMNKQNEFGATLGGPIRRDKTFFFGWYGGFTQRVQTSRGLTTVPTAAMRGGDLSNVLGPQISTCGANGDQACFDALGRPVYAGEIYDPATQRTVAAGGADPVSGLTNTSGSGAIIRDGFGFDPATGQPIAGAANIISSNRISPVASKVFSYFPSPTLSGQQFGYTLNWPAASKFQHDVNIWGSKIDHVISEPHRISGEFMWLRDNNPTGGGLPEPLGGGSLNLTQQDIARFSHDWFIRPNLVNHWVAGYNRWRSDAFPAAGTGWPAKIGWAGVVQTGPGSVFPGLSIGGLGSYGNSAQGYDVGNTFTFDEGLTWTKSRHTIKAGFGYVKMQQNDQGFGSQSGNLVFNAGLTSLSGSWYADGCNPGGACPGLGMGSFLLGLGSSGEAMVYAASNADRMGQYAGYIQDDYKATSKLTLNFGLRYDLLLPTVTAHNQMSWMDPTEVNVDLGIRGAVVFASPSKRSPVPAWTKGFGPRAGLAYALNDKTVLRMGYGILYTLGGAQRSHRGLYLQGYNSDNLLGEDASAGYAGLQPSFTLDAGWPASNFPAPPFLSPSYGLGGAPHSVFPGEGRPPMIRNWTLGIQRQIPGQILLDVAYVGTQGNHLPSRLMPGNVTPTKYLSDPTIGGTSRESSLLFRNIAEPAVQGLSLVQALPVDAATGNHSPFPGYEALYGENATLGQALRPFPQYTREVNSQLRDFMEGVGVSNYHALQVHARKQFSQGLTFLISYTWSKTLTDAESIFNEFSGFTQDYYNRKAEKALSINDYPNNLILSYEYQLPFGPGRHFLKAGGSVGKVVGGWSIAGIQQYQSGRPQMIYTGSNPYDPYFGPNSFVMRPNEVPRVPQKSQEILSGKFDPNRDSLLNINAWTDPKWGTFGNAPRSYGGIRMPAYLNEDITLLKRTPLTERVGIEFRADFLNIFNRTVLGPDQGGDQYDSILQGNALDWGAGSFGHVTSQGNYPREIQFGVKINY